jgi:hypothetical protein
MSYQVVERTVPAVMTVVVAETTMLYRDDVPNVEVGVEVDRRFADRARALLVAARGSSGDDDASREFRGRLGP